METNQNLELLEQWRERINRVFHNSRQTPPVRRDGTLDIPPLSVRLVVDLIVDCAQQQWPGFLWTVSAQMPSLESTPSRHALFWQAGWASESPNFDWLRDLIGSRYDPDVALPIRDVMMPENDDLVRCAENVGIDLTGLCVAWEWLEMQRLIIWIEEDSHIAGFLGLGLPGFLLPIPAVGE